MSRFVRIPLLIMLTALAAVVTPGAANPAAPTGRRAASALPRPQPQYVPMPDGVQLAADVWLPADTTAGAAAADGAGSRPVLARLGNLLPVVLNAAQPRGPRR